jgi:hypothetical protein
MEEVMSKRAMCLILMACVPMLLLYGTESLSLLSWNINDNMATYSGTLSSISADGSSAVDWSQFNADSAVAAGEATGGTYTLTKVVITISGTISGNFTYTAGSTDGTVSQALLSSTTAFKLTAGSISTSASFSKVDVSGDPPLTVPAGTTVEHPYSVSSSGSTTITDALSTYIGNSTVGGSVGLKASLLSDISSGMTASVSASGSPTISVTYYYDAVPEPTSLALLGLGCVAILARRRFRKTTEI